MREPIVSRLKVLHVFSCLNRGGAEMRFVELVEHLPAGEFQVDVCALMGHGSLDGRIRAQGGEIIPLALGRSFPGRFLSLLRRLRYAVVHSHVLYASGPILALAAIAGVAVRVAHFHAIHDGRASTPARRLTRCITRALLNVSATDIIACGEGSMDAMWHPSWRHDARCRVVYDALDPAPFERPVNVDDARSELGVPTTARVFLHVGNNSVEKNHRRLLEIFAAIRLLEPSSWLVLAGRGTDDPGGTIGTAIRELALADRVRQLGVREDVPRLLKASDVLLLPSLREGLPGAALEACAAGVPVLATDLPGVREVAARVGLVRFLPLAVSDTEWAAAAVALPDEAEHIGLRHSAARAFRASVFHVDRAVEAHRALWRQPVHGAASCF